MSYYQCYRCNFISKQKTGMIRHLDRKIKCIKNIQSYKYSDDELYKLSLTSIKENSFDNELLNECKYCYKQFSTKGNLKKHIIKHEDGSIPVYPKEYYENKNRKNNQITINKKNSYNNLNNGNHGNNTNHSGIHNYSDSNSNITNDTEYIQYCDDDKNINQTINNITVNQQFNNYNIINMKYPNSFDKDWDLSQISYENKLFLINTCNTKYSELLRFILQNDDNLNIIIENETNTGIVYKNDIEKYIHLNKEDIIDQSLTKLNQQLNNLCKEISLKNDNPQLDNKFEFESLSINKKFQDYKSNNNNIKNGVETLICDIFNEKKDKTISLMNQIIEAETNNNLLENNGF